MLKDFFKKKPKTTAPQSSGEMTYLVHSLTQGKRKTYQHYIHFYVATLVQVGAKFEVELRSQLFNVWQTTSPLGNPWSYSKEFETFEAAKEHLKAVLENPERFAKQTLKQTDWWADSFDSRSKKYDLNVIFSYERPAGIDNGQLAEEIATGKTKMPNNVAAGELVRQLYGRPEKAARAAVLDFLQKAPFSYGYWGGWKWLYKQAEAKLDLEALAIALPRLDKIKPPDLKSSGDFGWSVQWPTFNTMVYMKRRGRRFLQRLSQQNPSVYQELAYTLLKQNDSELDLSYQWLTVDILNGTARRFSQFGHGRGKYALRIRRISLNTQDVRAADAWAKHPDNIITLVNTANLPWQIQEWALKMLLANKIQYPALSEATLLGFLQGQSPLLIRLATAQVVAIFESGGAPDSELAAYAFLYGKATQRQIIRQNIQEDQVNSRWGDQFGMRLAGLVGQFSGKLSGRYLEAALLLAQKYPGSVNARNFIPIIPALYFTGRAEFRTLIVGVLSHFNLSGIPQLLGYCQGFNREQRREFNRFVAGYLQKIPVNFSYFYPLVFNNLPVVMEFGWELLAITGKTGKIPAELWSNILNWAQNSSIYLPTLETALCSPAAIQLLPKDQLIIKLLQRVLLNHPTLFSALAPETAMLLMKHWQLGFILKLISEVDDSVWLNLKESLIAELREDGRLLKFWREVMEAIPGDANGRFATRILNDKTVAQSFYEVADEGFLDKGEPAFSTLLVEWIGQQPDLFSKNSPALLKAATHKLPEIREQAFRQLDEVGLDMPFALRLLESGLPEVIARGKLFFEAIPPGHPQELEYTLAILDSPERYAQAFGREFLLKRQGNLPSEEVTRRLAEHPAPQVQELVATRLLQQPEVAKQLPEFDSSVLRARNRGRKVKELVKKRLEQTAPTNLDKTTLLEMTHSRTPRDAEWAWQELARLAMAGEEIPGLEIGPLSGI